MSLIRDHIRRDLRNVVLNSIYDLIYDWSDEEHKKFLSLPQEDRVKATEDLVKLMEQQLELKLEGFRERVQWIVNGTYYGI